MMIRARLYQPSKTSMQSGKAKTRSWVLEFLVPPAYFQDKLMGWTGSTNTLSQAKLWFNTKEEAISYAASYGVELLIDEPKCPILKPKAYSDNFRFDRVNYS